MAGLTLVSLGFTSLVAIWPSDNIDVVDAKLALAEVTRPHVSQGTDYVPSLSPETATRIRIKRAAFSVGELVVPAGPAAPSSCDHGLAGWPLTRCDLTTLLPPRGGSPVFADAQVQAWAGVMENVPNLAKIAAPRCREQNVIMVKVTHQTQPRCGGPVWWTYAYSDTRQVREKAQGNQRMSESH